MRVTIAVCACLIIAASVSAQPLVEDDFESYTPGAVACDTFTAGVWDFCNQGGSPGASCDLSVVTSIDGYSGSIPSGSQLLRMEADSTSFQTECTLRIFGGADYIPASVWLSTTVYIRSGGTSNAGSTNRFMKFWYPCDGDYPCGAESSSGSWIFGLGRNINAPLDVDEDNSPSPSGWAADDMVFEVRSNTRGTVSLGGTASLGQTSLSEWLHADRMNVMTLHMDNSTAGACHYRGWVGEFGSALTLVMDLEGGQSYEGNAFTCDFSAVGAVGHTQLSFISTIPNNNSTGVVLDMYFDDPTVASASSDLPAYAQPDYAPASSPVRLRIRGADLAWLMVAAVPIVWRRRLRIRGEDQ